VDTHRIQRWATLGANVGVLIGIVLLVVELEQNREMMRAQTRNEISRGLTELQMPIVENAEIAEMIARANNGETLSPNEAFRLRVRSELVFRYWENEQYQYRHGLYEESEFSADADAIAAVISANPSLLNFWCEERSLYSTSFRNFIDDSIQRDTCD